jgi:hypothetical protein
VIFNQHKDLDGQHAFLSASKYSWVNYDLQRLDDVYSNWRAAQTGTELHELAAKLIRLGIRLPKTNKTLNMYVNDCIGFRMEPEVTLYFSENAFGTADAISFRKGELKIFDLKSGKVPASIKQVEIYTAYFCLEYNQDPCKIDTELRLYQSDQMFIHHPDPADILYIQDKIIAFDKRINEIKS